MRNTHFFRNIAVFVTALLLAGAPLHAQENASRQQKVAGTVVDRTGEPVIGAAILIQGKPGVGTVTDEQGAFSLTASENDLLEVSCIGYVTQTVPVTGATLNIVPSVAFRMKRELLPLLRSRRPPELSF